ncbi:MAG: phytanoyl-CoA dioxygenase family protein [Candidatus Promineifilaceae bacterium]
MSNSHQQFLQDGFYQHSEPVIPAELVQRAVEGMEMIRRGEYDTGNPPYESPWNPGDSDDVLCKIEMPILANKAIMELASHPALAKLAAEVADAEMIQVWWVQLLRKPTTPDGGSLQTNVGMHQDFFYWQNHWDDNSELFTAWVAVSDVTPEAGSMHFVRGSHNWGLGEDSDFFGQDLSEQKAAIASRTGDEWDEVASSLRPGGVSFHHCLTYHGSGPNTSGAPRLGFAIHMRTEKSQTKKGRRDGLTEFIDNEVANPIVFGDRMPESLPASK